MSAARRRAESLPVVDLHGAFVRRTDLTGADLRGANLSYADASHASFRGADFEGARLRGTILRGADLTDARNLTAEQIAEAVIDGGTLLPSHLQSRPQRSA